MVGVLLLAEAVSAVPPSTAAWLHCCCSIWCRCCRCAMRCASCRMDPREELNATTDDVLHARVDAVVAACEVTDVKSLPRYHFEDVIQLQVDTGLVVYFQSNK